MTLKYYLQSKLLPRDGQQTEGSYTGWAFPISLYQDRSQVLKGLGDPQLQMSTQ